MFINQNFNRYRFQWQDHCMYSFLNNMENNPNLSISNFIIFLPITSKKDILSIIFFIHIYLLAYYLKERFLEHIYRF